ncbi:MAG: GNAT family N-acetyltransferase [Chromatiales bacterium]|nr:GNAT family N-acetyltransferase [Gammaproteobacteria bacterium]MBW6477266.1 GNAT family N-acetyltransferase [Chromatiales bacterium]
MLAPLAVLPDHQQQGIGSRLVEEGLAQLRAAGVSMVFTLGHPRISSALSYRGEERRCLDGAAPG